MIGEAITRYFRTWWAVMVRPIYFFTFIPQGPWQDEALTFAGYSAWITSFFLAIAVFIIQQVPIGLRLIEWATPKQMIIASPVLAVFSVAFFAMTFLIVGGVMLAAVIGSLYVFGVILHGALRLLGGKGNILETIKASMYSGAVVLVFVVPVIFAILTKYHIAQMWQLSTVENIVYYGTCLYVYGLWSIAGKKVHDVPKWKAFLAAILPLAILVLLGVVFHAKVFPKIDRFLV